MHSAAYHSGPGVGVAVPAPTGWPAYQHPSTWTYTPYPPSNGVAAYGAYAWHHTGGYPIAPEAGYHQPPTAFPNGYGHYHVPPLPPSQAPPVVGVAYHGGAPGIPAILPNDPRAVNGPSSSTSSAAATPVQSGYGFA
jgi:hypothetical protein